jgi:RNA polymerase sigma-70 factor (ECF subfamily)
MRNGTYVNTPPGARLGSARTDEELILELARGDHESLGPLYLRHAPAIFRLADHSLGRAAAEEIVQEVFLAIWRSASSFDPRQGAFRPWLFQVAHWKILNELRRRRRRPAEQPAAADDNQDDFFGRVPDSEPGPEERAWQTEHRHILHAALAALPARQREAVSMAFLDDMTHQEVARALDVPLGTAKTRIRSGLELLRANVAPLAASLLGVGLALVGFRYVQSQAAYERDERALSLVTTSDVVPLRLTPASAQVPAAAHANYRGRAGTTLAVLTTEALSAPPPGRVYQAWVRHADTWTALGTFEPNADGTARLIAENSALAAPPDSVEITLEPAAGSPAPNGAIVLSWSAP